MPDNGIWITWEFQRRNVGLSSALGFPLHVIVHEKPRLLRYIKSTVDTLAQIYRSKTKVLCIQNPSIVLAIISILARPIFRYKLIIDAHSGGIEPLMGRFKLLMVISKWIQKKADITIVTNDWLSAIVKSNGGHPIVLPDKIPEMDAPDSFPLIGKQNIAFITTYSPDEPVSEVIAAAELLPDNIMIYFTGDYTGKLDPATMPDNVRLLGYLAEGKYWSLLASVDFIMDLTIREGCLVCGAYEGIALSKPLILSDTDATRTLFDRGCVYVKPSKTSIADGIRAAIRDSDRLTNEVPKLKMALTRYWSNQINALNDRLLDFPTTHRQPSE